MACSARRRPANDPLRREERRAGKEDRELVATDPRNEVAVAHPGLEDATNSHEGFVARFAS